MNSRNGGPAFPGKRLMNKPGEFYNGMSLRDWFAVMAMQTYLADNTMIGDQSNVARWSYQLADAMIAEREKEEKSK